MAARFWVGGTGTWDASDTTHWAATSGGAGGQSVPVAGDNVTIDASSGAGTITVNTDFSISSLTCGAMGMTLDFSANNNSPTFTGNVSTSGTGTRTINWGSGTFTLSNGNATVFGNGTTTNQTMTGSATFNFTYSGSVGTRQVQFGGTGAGTFSVTTCSVNVTAGTDTFSFSGTNTGVPSLNFTGFSGTWASSSTSISFRTNLTMSATMTNSVTAILQWIVASSSGTITSNGKSFASAFIINTNSGTVALADAFVTTSSLTLTLGTFNASGFNVTCGSFASSNTNTRTLTMGSGQWTITGNAATVWDITTFTNLTFSKGSLPVIFNYSGSTGTRTIINGAITPLQLSSAIDVSITAGTDAIAITNSRVGHLVFTGFSGTLQGGTRVIYGNLTVSSGMTWLSGTPVTTFAGTSGTQVITTNGKDLNTPFTVAGVGGTVSLAGNFSMDGASPRTLTISNGVFDANNYNVICGILDSSSTNIRSIIMGAGRWTLTGVGSVFNLTTMTNLTFDAGTSNIHITDVSASSKTIVHGTSLALYDLTITPGGAGEIIFGANSLSLHALNLNGGSKTLQFAAGAGSTTTVSAGGWNVNGISGSLVSLTSGTPGSPAFISIASGLVNSNYLSVTDSTAQGGAYFQAVNSTNGGGNTGWNFVTASAGGGLQAGKRFAAFGGARPINKVLDSKLHGYRKLGG